MSITVTATASGAGSANGIEIAPLVYTGASLTQNGATAASETVTAPELAITPHVSGSVVVGAVGTGGSATAFSSPAGSITSVANSTVVSGGRWGIYRSGSTTTSSTTYGWAAPTGTSGNIYIAQAEILASGTLALDASTPAVASTSSAKTITSASFTPPAGAVLVVPVLAQWSGSGAVSLALSDSSGAYTWSQLAGTGTTDLASVWVGIPAVAHTPSASLTVSPSFTAAGTAAHSRTASLTVTPSFSAPAGHSPGTFLVEAGGRLLTEDGGRFLVEAGAAANTAAASLTVAPSLAATPAVSHVRSAALTVTPSLSAVTALTVSAALTVTPVLSAARTASHVCSASLTVTPSFTATSVHGHNPSASLTVTPSLAAAAAVGVSAALTVTPSFTAAALHTHAPSATLTVTPVLSAAGTGGTPSYTATASLTVTPVLSADGTQGHFPGAALTVIPSFTATSVHAHFPAASLTVSPSFSAAAVTGTAAALTVTPSFTATALHAHAPSASLTVSPSFTAAVLHAHAPSAALAVTPSFSAPAAAAHVCAAALTVTPTFSAAAAVGISASLTVSPSFTAARVQVHARGAALTVSPSLTATRTHARVVTAALTVTPSFTAVAAVAAPESFPAIPLDLDCELLLGGTWTDVSSYVYQRAGDSPPVSITRGRPDESSQANPATASWEWNNRDGRFSPKNPVGPYYGMLGRNTPVRWSVPAQSNHLRLENDNFDRAYVNDTASIDITGSIEMRIQVKLTDWQGCVLACKWDGGGCWRWLLNSDGTITFSWFDASVVFWSVTSSQPVPFTTRPTALRVTMNASTGTVTFYTASSIDGTYTQLGTAASATGGASTSILVAHGSALAVGYSFNTTPAQLFGRVGEYRLYNGLAGSGGTVAADGIFSSQAAGAATWTDSAGNTWNVTGGAEISSRDYRVHGEMSSQPPKWDVTGRDMRVMAQAGGPLRRLSQGTANAMSAMKRAISLQTGSFIPVAYWPMEDAAGASVFGSAIGGPPMTFDASPAPTLATDSTFLASAPLPTTGGSRLQGPVPPYTATGTWTVRFLLKVSAPASNATLLRIVCPSGACPIVYINVDTSGNLELEGFAPNGSSAFNTGFANFGATAGIWCSVEAVPAGGGGVQYNLVGLTPGSSVGGELTATVSNGLPSGNVSLVQPDTTGAFTDTAMGHMQVQGAWQSLFNFANPLNAWQGETAGARYSRLAGENGYQARIIGSPGQSAMMGAQGQATLSALLAEVEAADLGQQFEPRQQLSLGYRTLASMCNQSPRLTLNYTASEPGGVSGDPGDSGLDPTFDDQLTANDWTVTRGAASGNQGATVQAQLADGSEMSISNPSAGGVGDYAKTATANVQYDAQLPDVAGWMVRRGSISDERWPVIPLNLARSEMTALWWNALDTDIGDALELDSLPDAVLYDPVRQLAFGTKEALGGFHYTQEFNAVPESPYEVAILDDPVYGRADTDGSQLAAGVSSSATTLSVATTGPSGILWTTSASDLPFDIAVSGERMTVTNITGSSSPQAFTVVRSVNGVVKAQSSGADVRLWFAPILALT